MATSTSSPNRSLEPIDLSSPALTDLQLILQTFAEPVAIRANLNGAYAYLARLLLSSSKNEESNAKDEHVLSMAYIIGDWLEQTHLSEVAKAFAALSAVLQVDMIVFTTLLNTNAMQEKILDAAETLTSDFKIANEDEFMRSRRHLAAFVSNAAGYSSTRSLACSVAMMDSQWLFKSFLNKQEDQEIRLASAVALIKLKKQDAVTTKAASSLTIPSSSDLLPVITGVVAVSDAPFDNPYSLALEGLALLTLQPSARREISGEKLYISAMFKRVQQDSIGETHFSIATILNHLSSYHRHQGDDEGLRDRLRRYANTNTEQNDPKETEETDIEIDQRLNDLIQLGAMQAMVKFAKSTSPTVRGLTASILLNFIDKRERRGLVIQQGGAKLLLHILKDLSPSPSSKNNQNQAHHLDAVQALSKLLITANPLLVLGPAPTSSALLDSIKPLTLPVLSSAGSLLQQFEAIMALTNIAGLSEHLQDRISGLEGLMERLEEIMLDGNSSSTYDGSGMDGKSLGRRAATELVCNLIPSEVAFLRYTTLEEDKRKEQKLTAVKANRLQLLIALSDAEDIPTRQAALGALATLTLAPATCAFINEDAKRMRLFLSAGQDSDPGTQLRALECLKNIAISQKSARDSLKLTFQDIVNSANVDIRLAAEAGLHALSQS